MALFQKSTKTRVSGAVGNVRMAKFISAEGNKSICIRLTDPSDGRQYSLTLYGNEFDALKEKVNDPNFNDQL